MEKTNDPKREVDEKEEEEFFAKHHNTQASQRTKPHLSHKHTLIHKKFLLAQNFRYMEVSQVFTKQGVTTPLVNTWT